MEHGRMGPHAGMTLLVRREVLSVSYQSYHV